jgi:putative transposase
MGAASNPHVERLIGSIRRECLDHVIVWNEKSLRRILRSYFQYYEKWRTHLALAKDALEPRAVKGPENGHIVAIPQVGGLHHRYERRAAWSCFATPYWGRSMPSRQLGLLPSSPAQK